MFAALLSSLNMQLRYDEDFIEAAVFLCASGRRNALQPFASPEAKGCSPHPLQIARFHREREKLYAILDPDERNTAFFKLHLDWFREWGLEKLLTDLLKEFPLLPAKLNVLAVRKTRWSDGWIFARSSSIPFPRCPIMGRVWAARTSPVTSVGPGRKKLPNGAMVRLSGGGG